MNKEGPSRQEGDNGAQEELPSRSGDDWLLCLMPAMTGANPSLLPRVFLTHQGSSTESSLVSSIYKPFSFTALSWPPSYVSNMLCLFGKISKYWVEAGFLMPQVLS